MKTKIFIAVTFLLISNNYIYSQVYQSWVSKYSGPFYATDWTQSIASDSLGNVYITGHSFNSIDYDYVTIKYNTEGRQVWLARYSSSNFSDDKPVSVAVGKSGNVYVTGNSNEECITIKYDSSGNQLWIMNFNGNGTPTNKVNSLTLDKNENVYIAGGTAEFNMNSEAFVLKYNSSGVEKWFAKYSGPVNNPVDDASSVAVDNEKNVYITGLSSGVSGNWNFATIKFDSNGIRQWVSRFIESSGIVYDTPKIAVDELGNVFIAGTSNSSISRYDYTTIKYNSSGVQQWVSKYNGPFNKNDIVWSMILDKNSNVYVTGTSSFGNSQSGFATIKYTSNGNQEWVMRYDGPLGDDGGRALAIDNANNIYVTGRSSTGPTAQDFLTIKYNSSGIEQWNIRYNGGSMGYDEVMAIVLDRFENIFVTGISSNNLTGGDYSTVKYTQSITTGFSNNITSNLKEFSLFQNYPNPFNPKTIINYQCSIFNFVSLKVFDILGNEVVTLVNEKQNEGSYQVEFDGSNLSSGIYFYKITAGDFSEVKKMTLVK